MPNMVFTASRSAGDDISVPISIPFTVSGTATFASDYTVTGAATFTATNGSMTIPSGQASAAITISTIPDTIPEADETIILTPTAQAGSWVVGASAWTGIILNDDGSLVDPSFASVVFLLIPSGADNSTVFVDSSSSAKVITTVGNTKILSKQAVFDGSGDNLTANASIDFTMTGDFTIEGKFKGGTNSTYATFVSRSNPGFNAGAWTALQDPTGRLAIFWADFSTSNPILTSINPINDNTAHDFAWVRSGNNLMLFLDGILQASVSSSASMANAVGNLAIATDLYFSGRDYAGSIAGVRITKGVARYTSNYTPPTNYPIN